MSPAQLRLGALRAEVERDWGEVRRQVARSSSVSAARGEPEAAFVALALDHAYQALEQIMVAIERALRLPARAGENWHRAVLSDAARPLPGIRPAVVAPESERDWGELLGFRHFLRHAYAANLDPERLQKNVERLTRAVLATEPFIAEALAVLEPADDGF